MLNFGKVRDASKHICFDVPDANIDNFEIPSIEIPKINTPHLPDISSGILSFGKKIVAEIENVAAELEKLKPSLPKTTGSLSFSLPGLKDFSAKLNAIKVPTTICVSVGGTDGGISAIFDQINSAIDTIKPPQFNLPVPDLSKIPFLPISNLVPALRFGPIIPVNQSMDQILSELKERCALAALDALDGLDPLLRLEQLIQRFQELCGLLRFSELQSVIDKIEQAKADLVRKVIDSITDPAEKLAKLYDMAVDAVNTGAQDIVNEISRQIDRLKFDSLIDQILKMNPADAIAALSDEIKQQAQLKNFGAIRQLLTAINIVKSQFEEIKQIGDVVLDAPENFIDSLQNKINELLTLQDYEGIEKLLAAYDNFQDGLIRQLSELDPERLLQEGSSLLREAIEKLDLGRYNRIMDEMASTICDAGKNLLPTLPNVPEINPDAIPSFLK